MHLIDTHTHLDFSQFDADRDDVIRRALEVDVKQMLTIGVDVPTSLNAVRLAEKYDSVYAAVGIHPHDAETATEEAVAEIEKNLSHKKVVAVGEIGLDYYRDYSPHDVQKEVFRRLLRIAKEHNKPVIVHTREAWGDVMAILEDEWSPGMRGVMHCFSGDATRAAELIEMGFYISFTGVVTFKNSTAADVLADVPIERLLLETDCPYMAPVPHRGKRNEPAYVRFIAQKAAQVKNISVETVAEVTTENAAALFDLA